MSLMKTFPTIFFLIVIVSGTAINNKIASGPQIECDDQMMVMTVNTVNPFSGRVYVKGEYANPDCVSNYVANPSTQSASITVPYNKCNVKRLRMSSQGIQYTTVIVVSFHSTFETKVDRAYKINCLFQQINNSFTAPSIEVSMIATTELTQNVGQIQCTYEVRRGSTDGPQVRYAVIGEAVYHVWKCEATNMRMLVRDCFVDDGQGNKVVTIDSLGCTADRYVIQTPTYVGPDYSMAWTESHVFKYADRPQVVFQCQIHMCDTADPDCQNRSPPKCNGTLAPTVGPTAGAEALGAIGRTHTIPAVQNQPPIGRTTAGPVSNFTHEPVENGTTSTSTHFNITSFNPNATTEYFGDFNRTTIGLQVHTSTGMQLFENGSRSITSGLQSSTIGLQSSTHGPQLFNVTNENEKFANVSTNFPQTNLSGFGNVSELSPFKAHPFTLRNFSQPVGNETVEQHTTSTGGLFINETFSSHGNTNATGDNATTISATTISATTISATTISVTTIAATHVSPDNINFSAPSGYGTIPQTRPIASQLSPDASPPGIGFGNVTSHQRSTAGFGNVSEHSNESQSQITTQKKPFVDVFSVSQTTTAVNNLNTKPNNGAYRLFRRSLNDDIKYSDSYVWDVLSNEITVMELDDDKGLDNRNQKKDSSGRSLSQNLDSLDENKSKYKNSICIPGYGFAITVGISIFSVLLSTTISVFMCNKKNRKISFL